MGQALSYISSSICGEAVLDEEERLFQQKLLIPLRGSRVPDEDNGDSTSYELQQRPLVLASPGAWETSAPSRAFIAPPSPPCSITDSNSTTGSHSNRSLTIPPPNLGHCLGLSSKGDVGPLSSGSSGDSNDSDPAFEKIVPVNVDDFANDGSWFPPRLRESKQKLVQGCKKITEEEKLRERVVEERELIKQGPKEEQEEVGGVVAPLNLDSFREHSDPAFGWIASANATNFVMDETRVPPNRRVLEQLINPPQEDTAEPRKETPEEEKLKKLQRKIINKATKKKEEEENLKRQFAGEAKRIKHYSSHQMILLVGEGDFSFSASLAVAFGSAYNMVATSLNAIGFLSTNYKKALENIQTLKDRGCKVLHGIDATKMANHTFFKGKSFDRIVFNFPHAGFSQKSEPQESQISQHQELVRLFLENAKKMIGEGGEIHITHKSNGFHSRWNLEQLAPGVGLRLIRKVRFKLGDYPGYNTKYGYGGDNNFDCNPSKTYKFGL